MVAPKKYPLVVTHLGGTKIVCLVQASFAEGRRLTARGAQDATLECCVAPRGAGGLPPAQAQCAQSLEAALWGQHASAG